jgi:hypothetical protein
LVESISTRRESKSECGSSPRTAPHALDDLYNDEEGDYSDD